jgi:hypothetical protein
MDEELRFHLEHKIEEGIARGLSAEEARRHALQAMGGLEQRKEEIRDARRIHWLTDFVDDARYASRSLRRTPWLSAFIVVTIAVGIGMTATPLSMLDALIFRPYPVPHPGSVVTLVGTARDDAYSDFSHAEYLDVRDHAKSYDGVIASTTLLPVGFVARPGATPEVRGGQLVSGNYFRVLGVKPQLGRDFRDDEDRAPGRDAVAVLAPDFWRRDLGADPAVVGRTIRPERHGLHGDRGRAGQLPGCTFFAPRLLRPARDGEDVLDQSGEELSWIATTGSWPSGHDPPAFSARGGGASSPRWPANLEREYPRTTAIAARRSAPSSRCGRARETSTGSSA